MKSVPYEMVNRDTAYQMKTQTRNAAFWNEVKMIKSCKSVNVEVTEFVAKTDTIIQSNYVKGEY